MNFSADFSELDKLTEKLLKFQGEKSILKKGLVDSGTVVIGNSKSKLWKPSGFPGEIHGVDKGTLRRHIRSDKIQESLSLTHGFTLSMKVGVFDVPYAHWIEEGESLGYKPKGGKGRTKGSSKGKSVVNKKVAVTTRSKFMGYHYMRDSLKESWGTIQAIAKKSYKEYIRSFAQ